MKKLFAMILTLAMVLLAAAAIPSSAAATCDRCSGTGLYECSECAGVGYYYRCPDHPGRTAFDSGQVCDDCGAALVFYNPCDNGCTDDGSGFYVAPCSKCNGAGVIATAPGMPKNLALTPGDKTVTMTWEAPANDGGSPITGYWVQRGIEGYDDDVVKVDLGPDVLTYTWDGLQNGKSYAFYVWAVNDVGQSFEATGGCAPGEKNPIVTLKWYQTIWQFILKWIFFGWLWGR